MQKSIDPTREQFSKLGALPKDQPVIMVNLLKFKAQVEGGTKTGQEQYEEYSAAATPFLVEAQAKVIWKGFPKAVVIGPKEEIDWDEMLLVEYPTVGHFFKMVQSPGYPHDLRSAALEDSRLIASLS